MITDSQNSWMIIFARYLNHEIIDTKPNFVQNLFSNIIPEQKSELRWIAHRRSIVLKIIKLYFITVHSYLEDFCLQVDVVNKLHQSTKAGKLLWVLISLLTGIFANVSTLSLAIAEEWHCQYQW